MEKGSSLPLMEKSIKTAGRTRKNLRKISFFPFLFLTLTASTQLIDQTVAVVGKRILTLQDLVAYQFVRNALNNKKTDIKEFRVNATEIFTARDEAVKAALIKNYLAITSLRSSIPDSELNKLKKSAGNLLNPSPE